MKNITKNGLLGVAIGDALGVPVEFTSRRSLNDNPVINMRAFGTHHQAAGTWSDDSSLTFCLAESLCSEFKLHTIANSFVRWFDDKEWTPHGNVFDIGITTRNAIRNIKTGDFEPELCGEFDEYSNGNGSLMRILPLAFYLKDIEDKNKRYELVSNVSSITHGHFRSVFSCFIYTEYLLKLFKGIDKKEAYLSLQQEILDFATEKEFNPTEIMLFDRLLKNDITDYPRLEIRGSGYVLHSLEASFWCFLHNSTYAEAVLEAVNLGDDTDTTGAITGGLAGIYYGIENIPSEWLEVLARKNDIIELAEKLDNNYF